MQFLFSVKTRAKCAVAAWYNGVRKMCGRRLVKDRMEYWLRRWLLKFDSETVFG